MSLRQVASAADVSTGMVQHYFNTKDEMMAFAIEVVQERVRARLESSALTDELERSPTSFVRSLLFELLPRDRRRRDDARVVLAFLAYAAVRPPAARTMRRDTVEFLRLLTDGVTNAQRDGHLREDLDPASAAKGLLALMDGLGLHVLSGYYSTNEAMDAFDTYIETIRQRQP